jgi:glycosyltransferase involved in cell wall biosynthesis
VVVSTALHEFFGVAVVEALCCGCLPLLPDRLTYPQLIPVQDCSVCLFERERELVERLRWAATHVNAVRDRTWRPVAAAYDWSRMATRYGDVLTALEQRPRRSATI